MMEYSEAALQKVREDRLLIDHVDTWLYEEIAPFCGRRVLEVGCGLGNFTRHFVDRELYVGTEVEPASVETVQRLYRDRPNVIVCRADATSPDFLQLAAHRVDTVFSLNVFEHIREDLVAMRNVFDVLQPGGRFVLVVPAHRWLYGSIDREIGHYRRYDKPHVAKAFSEIGYRVIDQKYINAAGALGWWFSARVLRTETPPSGQLRLFNHLVPALKMIERVVPMPFGISVLTVAEKPRA